MEFIAALLGPNLAGYLALALASIAAVFGIVLKSRAAGRAQERARHERESLEAFRDRSKIDDEIQNTPADERRKRLAGWVPDDRR